MRLIIDTDIGTDADDAIAIAYALRSGMDVRLITTVHGDALQRARIAKKFVSLLGYDTPIAAGESKPIKQTQLWWTGLEGKGFLNAADTDHPDITIDGVERLARTIYENAHHVNIAAIGPMTNIARAFQRYPDLPSLINHIYIMGNGIATEHALHLNYRAHNLKVDPEAADIVFGAAVPKTIITTEVSKLCYLSQEDHARLKESDNPALNYIASSAQMWKDHFGYDTTYLYDPLVIHHHLEHDAGTYLHYPLARIMQSPKPGFAALVMERLLEGQ